MKQADGTMRVLNMIHKGGKGMANTVGALIKEARGKAGLTQEKLAAKVGLGMSANDVSKAERGDLIPSQDQLKQIAKVTGVTQASLLNAAKADKGSSAKTVSKTAAKTAQKTTAKTTGRKTTAKAKTTAASKKTAAKTPANANSTMKVTAAERKLIEAYREASSDAKKNALKVLKGEDAGSIMSQAADSVGSLMGDVLGNVVGSLLGNK